MHLKGLRNVVRYRLSNGKSEVQIYDCKNSTRLPGTKARFENDKAVADNIVNIAFDYHAAVRDFLKKEFGVDSYDGKGGNLIGSVHYGVRYNNAFNNGRQMAYGDGDGQRLQDLRPAGRCRPRILPRRHRSVLGLEYYGESGALNESISGRVRRHAAPVGEEPQGRRRFLAGRPGLFADPKQRALRDMLNPGTAYNDANIGKDPQPDHYDRRYKGSSDNGGVHINSGIPNKAFATFAISLGGYAWQTAAGKVWNEPTRASAT